MESKLKYSSLRSIVVNLCLLPLEEILLFSPIMNSSRKLRSLTPILIYSSLWRNLVRLLHLSLLPSKKIKIKNWQVSLMTILTQKLTKNNSQKQNLQSNKAKFNSESLHLQHIPHKNPNPSQQNRPPSPSSKPKSKSSCHPLPNPANPLPPPNPLHPLHPPNPNPKPK